MDINFLLEEAEKAMSNSYSPYSKFKVGAAILTDSGKIYTGCNIENSSYGATICAERTAAVKAVSDGHIKFGAIAIVCSSGEYAYPCGICRQFLSEFMNEDSIVILNDKEKGIMTVNFKEIIPYAFSGDCIK